MKILTWIRIYKCNKNVICSNKVKLFFQYPTTVDSRNYGYAVGLFNYKSAKNEYYYFTSDYSVKTDSEIDSMYKYKSTLDFVCVCPFGHRTCRSFQKCSQSWRSANRIVS